MEEACDYGQRRQIGSTRCGRGVAAQVHVKCQMELEAEWYAPPMAAQIAPYRKAAGRLDSVRDIQSGRRYISVPGFGARCDQGNRKSAVMSACPSSHWHYCASIGIRCAAIVPSGIRSSAEELATASSRARINTCSSKAAEQTGLEP